MRISDWSSDVCSSDLCRTIEDFPRAATESGYAREIIPKLKPRMGIVELFKKGNLMRISKSLVLAASVLAPALAQAAEGDQIVVTATRAEKPLSQIGQSITIISQDEITARQSVTVVDLLRTVPGVTFTRTGGFGAPT